MTACGSDFCQFLVDKARAAHRQNAGVAMPRIVLPESHDARILAAAARAFTDGIADCILLGDKEHIAKTAAANNITLPENLSVRTLAPTAYAHQLVALRAHKGVNEEAALAILQNPLVVATMMVHENDADGMVAGAATASADVLRAALQIIGTGAQSSLVSSLFFMCFNDGVKIFADCALLPSPDAAQLAAIAVQSVKSARQFGITPIVAMLSYATGDSGKSKAVEKIHEAVRLAQELLPQDIPIAGPIQYDAAVSPSIAAKKMPQSSAAGNATILIFPDLSAGNITYKAVQQAADIPAVGPVLQGLAKPINDLSRGATVDDIYYTIAATAVQAASKR
ncbi:MAG: phosphate acetyltransferase [Candidatus Zeuxoniibacter abyssi]|nr:MAG: phosphate acetyltransferase [Candidatus Persebacteraceae bacterium AB1(2)]